MTGIKMFSIFFQMLLSVLRRGKLYLTNVGPESFLRALEEFKIGHVVERQTGNKKKVLALKLTFQVDDRESIRMFKLMFDKSENEGVIFDPLKMFGDEQGM